MSTASLHAIFQRMHGMMKVAMVMLLLPVMGAVSDARAQFNGVSAPAFSMSFDPGTIGPGSTAVLRYSITETSGAPVSDLAFVNILPAGLILALPDGAMSSCGAGTFDVQAGANISFTDGTIAPFASCEIEVLVTGVMPGTFMNVSGDLTSSAGNSGSASADLVIAADRPGFSKSFSSPTTVIGQREQLTFTIDNSQNTSAATNIQFSDTLPTGLVIADPANLTNTCNASITEPFPLDFTGGDVIAEPGSSVISLPPAAFPNQAAVAAGGACEIGVDVVSASIGVLDNISGAMVSAPPLGFVLENGRAVASLDAQGGRILLIKEFLADPVPPGDSVELRFTILNRDALEAASDIRFDDDLDATLSGLVASVLPATDSCGAGSQLTGSSLLSFSGGQLDARSQCSFVVTLQVPAGAAPGIYANASSAIEADFGGAEPVLGNSARDDLFVFAVPRLSKTFIENPAASGGTTTIEFTIENTSATATATDLSFTDELTNFLPIPLPVTLPAAGFCGASSTINVAFLDAGAQGLLLQGGELAPGASCTFQVGVNLPAGLPPSVITNLTGPISGTVDGEAVTGNPAEAQLQILGAPSLTKTFLADPVQPGDTVDLQFSLQYSENAQAGATGITFTDDLAATLSGLAAIGLPASDVCGTGSQLSGTTNLTLTGASLLPGQSCTFVATLQVPTGAAPGTYPNTTSAPQATVQGETAIGLAATDTLDIASLTFEKAFTDDPVLPGGTVSLSFTLRNDSTTEAASDIFFTDSLTATLAGLTAIGLPLNDVCGAGSQLQGTTFLIFTGGNLLPGESCTFTANLQVPAGAVVNDYLSVTSNLTATVAGNSLALPPATDVLMVDDLRLQLRKAFTDDPAGPGDTVTLQFTLDNLDADSAVSGISFTDDLDAALSGLQATGLPLNDICGAGSQLTGASVLTLAGGNLPASGQCVFDVTLQLPASLPSTGSVTNVTSEVSGTLGGLAVRGDPASADLLLQNLLFSKAFSSLAVAGGMVNLDYTISNPDPVNPASGLAFTDNLGSVIPGLVAVGLPQSDLCGTGSTLAGSSLVTLNNASIAPGASCSFSVTLQLPATAVPGSFPSASSALTSGGLVVAPPATATLTVEPPPLFAKAFAASTIVAGASTTLTFTIDNSASALPATALGFTDPLPAGLVLADPANPSSSCAGSISAAPGSDSIAFSGGNVGAGASCTLSVDVRALLDGVFNNVTGTLSSSSGSSAPASANLTVTPAPVPGFNKSFNPDSLPLGDISELTLLIDNSAALLDASGLSFNDPLPAGMLIATPSAANNGCGGTLTAPDGGSNVQLSGGLVAAGTSCQIRVNVVTTAAGVLVNTTSALSSSLGSSPAATATLTVRTAPGFSKSFAPTPVAAGAVSQLSFSIDNSAESVVANGLNFVDPLPAGLRIASPANASTSCTGGTLTAPAGGTQIDYSGGSVAAAAACSISVDIVGAQPGTWLNTSSPLDSSLGVSPPASATLVVNEDSDGVPAAVEDLAPNNGDGNDDGIPDGIQDDVASLPSFDGGGFITVVAGGGCSTINDVEALAASSQSSPPPPAVSFPFGLIGFALPCENASVDIIFHAAESGFSQSYFKFGPTTPGDPTTSEWFDFTAGAPTGATVNGNVWTLLLADNALGDSSGDDGIINDPGGPVSQALAEPEPVPALGAGMLALLLALLVLIAGLHWQHFNNNQRARSSA
ncbi:MAG: hypothetical protein Tsb0027_24990 [Wenzhouxiangellaceae bacterium]